VIAFMGRSVNAAIFSPQLGRKLFGVGATDQRKGKAMSYRKIGGLHFLRIGRLGITWYWSTSAALRRVG
jgi:hypothetical protein